ncbi:hypothetical protein H310_10702 [Aphanomyces invadans]|uniref:Putative auto-transporter adhesin head GIN domain-containing protein n=1 Tax=Aphanomyces invadans TaxID=157072 RepID=A0A024TQZ4_9STRA|nr:hypothetical protein H310_10702 [Aphanomyces invadans]ETV96056.1 hypothetical protein H310_10702 [Aphanomyces invadans]|eukprot:XP_008875367.1 hypothetical protein H310_10702 [Aphanomyces invadans]
MTEVTGSGQVALVADRVAANCMKLKGCGSGATLIAVNSTVNITGDAKVEVTASGGVNVVSDSFSASRLHSQVTGSGSVEIHTHSRFGAATIESQVTGSGHIQVVGQGSTERHDVSITGSGTVNSTMCASACDVKIMGSGYANFSDLNQVAAKVIGSGRVQQLTLVRLRPPYEVVAMPAPTPTAMPESARNWLKKAIFG